MTRSEDDLASMVRLLRLFPSGKATVTVGGKAIVSVDADRKTLDVETEGVADAGLRLASLMNRQGGRGGTIESSMHASEALSRLGWKLTLDAGGDRVLSMGQGSSRLTGRVSVNPLKLKKLLRSLG